MTSILHGYSRIEMESVTKYIQHLACVHAHLHFLRKYSSETVVVCVLVCHVSRPSVHISRKKAYVWHDLYIIFHMRLAFDLAFTRQ